QELRYQMVWSILARWAVNTPELLKVLGSSEMHLYSFLKKQYDRELDALTEYPQRRLTMADHEILADMGVMTELTKERLIEEAGFVRSEITQLLKTIN
ncbi:hypothetical protein OAR16_00570, partial [bacterium]|nr:hypothetical protein [bacterium]